MNSPDEICEDVSSRPERESGEFPASKRRALRGRKGRVLVVDDEPQIGNTLRLLLDPNHEIVPVTSAKSALERISSDGRFDVIFCDLMMPEISGTELYEKVAVAAPELLDRFVFMTGGVFSAEILAFLERIPNPCIEKPFDIVALTALIEERIADGAVA